MSRRTTAWSRQRAARRKRWALGGLALGAIVAWQGPTWAAATLSAAERHVVIEGRKQSPPTTARNAGHRIQYLPETPALGPLTIIDAALGPGCVVEATQTPAACQATVVLDRVDETTGGVVVTARLHSEEFTWTSPALR